MPNCLTCGETLHQPQFAENYPLDGRWYHRREDGVVVDASGEFSTTPAFTLWCNPDITGRIDIDVAIPEYRQTRLI